MAHSEQHGGEKRNFGDSFSKKGGANSGSASDRPNVNIPGLRTGLDKTSSNNCTNSPPPIAPKK
jgi:hypothetical protein